MVCPGEVPFVGLVGGTPSDQSFIYRRVLCIPVEPVLSVSKKKKKKDNSDEKTKCRRNGN